MLVECIIDIVVLRKWHILLSWCYYYQKYSCSGAGRVDMHLATPHPCMRWAGCRDQTRTWPATAGLTCGLGSFCIQQVTSLLWAMYFLALSEGEVTPAFLSFKGYTKNIPRWCIHGKVPYACKMRVSQILFSTHSIPHICPLLLWLWAGVYLSV